MAEKQVYVLRYKRSNQAFETLHLSAESAEHAQAACEKWCRDKATGLQPYRIVRVDPWLAFDAEELLKPPAETEVPARAEPLATRAPSGVRRFFQKESAPAQA